MSNSTKPLSESELAKQRVQQAHPGAFCAYHGYEYAAEILTTVGKYSGKSEESSETIISNAWIDADSKLPALRGGPAMKTENDHIVQLHEKVGEGVEMPALEVTEEDLCECGHKSADHEWHDEFSSCCLAKVKHPASFGLYPKQCMCTGFIPKLAESKPSLIEDGNGNKTHYHAEDVDSYISSLRRKLSTIKRKVLQALTEKEELKREGERLNVELKHHQEGPYYHRNLFIDDGKLSSKNYDDLSDDDLSGLMEYSETCKCQPCYEIGYMLKLRKELASLRTSVVSGEWIDCRDRLPPTEDMVLTYGVHDKEWRAETARHVSGKFWTNGHIVPSYWMPLPDPPIEREG